MARHILGGPEVSWRSNRKSSRRRSATPRPSVSRPTNRVPTWELRAPRKPSRPRFADSSITVTTVAAAYPAADTLRSSMSTTSTEKRTAGPTIPRTSSPSARPTTARFIVAPSVSQLAPRPASHFATPTARHTAPRPHRLGRPTRSQRRSGPSARSDFASPNPAAPSSASAPAWVTKHRPRPYCAWHSPPTPSLRPNAFGPKAA
jgi:hypothetical protein